MLNFMRSVSFCVTNIQSVIVSIVENATIFWKKIQPTDNTDKKTTFFRNFLKKSQLSITVQFSVNLVLKLQYISKKIIYSNVLCTIYFEKNKFYSLFL